MDKKKTIILVEEDSTNIFNEFYKKNNLNVDVFFKKTNKIIRAIRRIWIKNLPNKEVFFSSWYKKITSYNTLIINMNKLTRYSIETINKEHPNTRIIGWYWNTIDEANKPIYFNKNIDYYSFDKKDCKKYNLKYNTQYYYLEENYSEEKEIDVFFVGRDKGRKKEIELIKEVFKKNDISFDCNIITNDRSVIPYNQVKKKLAKSKATLEINKSNQEGLTLRALESLFFGIKLITNNKSITELPLYNKNNVFIIGVDDYSALNNFINSEFDHNVDFLKEQYSINTWFNNFDN